MVIRDQVNQFRTISDLSNNSPNIKDVFLFLFFFLFLRDNISDVNCILSFKWKPKVNYSLPTINDNLYLLGSRDEAIIELSGGGVGLVVALPKLLKNK